jgi:hypothetical protein
VLLDESNPYRPLLDQLQAFRSAPVTVEEVAQAVASALEDANGPLRIPVGAPATTVLAARKAAPEDVHFSLHLWIGTATLRPRRCGWAPPSVKTVDDPNGIGTTTINGLNSAGDLVGFYSVGNIVNGFLATVNS